ncbi:MAG TPA: RNA-binding protein [Patescibacteria group bacterium]|nr:RNA-binding protein [Patescibacteria group bacterium]
MNKRLFVAGLPFTTTEEELRNLFTEVGVVVSVKIITDRETGRSKGFGFVEMETPEEATGAIAKLNDTDFGGRKLVVAEAKPMEERPRREFGGGQKTFGRREGGRGSFGRDGRQPGFRRGGRR